MKFDCLCHIMNKNMNKMGRVLHPINPSSARQGFSHFHLTSLDQKSDTHIRQEECTLARSWF